MLGSTTIHAREDLIELLQSKYAITDQLVLGAIRRVPRERFVPSALHSRAYSNDALPIDCSQTISQPLTVAIMSQLLQAKPGMSVLEIGTGSGYQAAILYEMGLRVFSVERHAPLLEEARQRFKQLGYNIASHRGDGSIGWSAYAPYDRIIVTAGAPEIPSALLKQLAPDGILVIPVGGEGVQRMIVARRLGDTNEVECTDHGEFKFVPLVGKEGWQNSDLRM